MKSFSEYANSVSNNNIHNIHRKKHNFTLEDIDELDGIVKSKEEKPKRILRKSYNNTYTNLSECEIDIDYKFHSNKKNSDIEEPELVSESMIETIPAVEYKEESEEEYISPDNTIVKRKSSFTYKKLNIRIKDNYDDDFIDTEFTDMDEQPETKELEYVPNYDDVTDSNNVFENKEDDEIEYEVESVDTENNIIVDESEKVKLPELPVSQEVVIPDLEAVDNSAVKYREEKIVSDLKPEDKEQEEINSKVEKLVQIDKEEKKEKDIENSEISIPSEVSGSSSVQYKERNIKAEPLTQDDLKDDEEEHHLPSARIEDFF